MTATLIMIDGIATSVVNIPASAAKVAGYVTGGGDIEWTTADWDRFKGVKVTIDQSPQGQSFALGKADVLDVETGAATIADAVSGIPERQKAGRYSTVYVDQGNLQALKDALSGDKSVKLNQVGYWVANWDLSQAEATAQLGNEIVAIQFASPASNPDTILPGSSLTLKEANCDLSVTLKSWYAPADPPTPWYVTALKYAQALEAGAGELKDLLGAHQS